jgi:hypothetical protein
MDTPVLPDVRLPFATAVHPESARVQETTEAWCAKHGLLRDPRTFRALGYGRIMSTLVPHVPFAGLALVVDWNSLFFVTDDQQNLAVTTGRVERYEQLVASMRRMIAGEPAAAGHPLLGALADLLQRTLPGRPACWMARLRANLDRWLRGHLAENAYRLSGTVPGVADYIDVRRDASTVLPTLDLVELVEHATIPDELYRTPTWQTLVLGTADIMCWINDIHSLHKEKGDPINLVTVLDHHERLGTRHAMAAVAARVAARVDEHLAAARELPDTLRALGIGESAPVLRCVADMRSWAAGMEIWDRTDTIRFAGADAPTASYVDDLLDSDDPWSAA